MSSPKVKMVGLPEFWQTAHDLHPEAFQAVHRIIPLQQAILEKPLEEPFHIVVRHIAKVTINSLGALTTLLLNGYGHDGMKIARSIFEAAVTVRYLAKHPSKFQDYLDYIHIRRKKALDYIDQNVPELAKKVSPEDRKEIAESYHRIFPQFKTKRGGVRNSWSDKPLSQMAAEVGMGEQYQTFYSWASSLHHADVSGLASQTHVSGDVDIAPSKQWIGEALLMGHQGALLVLGTLNDVAKLGMEAKMQAAIDEFSEIWGR